MVLPEGVLNNKNLAAVREYFEGKAKIILICSIPQDVFIAAGATVKPSLVFMKRFTAEEEQEYAKCKVDALAEVTALHQSEIDALTDRISNDELLEQTLSSDLDDAKENLKQVRKAKGDVTTVQAEIDRIKQAQKNNKADKKDTVKSLDTLKKQLIEESKPLVKRKFDYDIPIAKVDDAGITTTGTASSGNQLPQLLKEYDLYRKGNKVWEEKHSTCQYSIKNTSFFRKIEGQGEVNLNG